MKVLLVVIDAATPHVVCPAIHARRLPTLQRLADAGTLHEASVSIFPSITPAATTSIITGAYPAEHGIAGAAWCDEALREVAYYGDDFWVIAREGSASSFASSCCASTVIGCTRRHCSRWSNGPAERPRA